MADVLMPDPGREMTDEDTYALIGSDLWLRRQDLTPYQKKWVAVLSEKVIDSDADEEALGRRVVALWPGVDVYRVLIRYIPGYDELEG